MPKGLQDYGQAVASRDNYAEANNLIPEQKQAGLNRLAKGNLPECADIKKTIVDGYKDGALIAGVGYLGPAASVGKVTGGAIIGAIANGTYQWFDISSEKNQSLPENQQKTWDYKGSLSAGVTGALAPGRWVWQNVGIASGGSLFSDGPSIGGQLGAGAGALAGGAFGLYMPAGVDKVIGGNNIPDFVYDVIGSGGSEVIGGFIKDGLNTDSESKKKSE